MLPPQLIREHPERIRALAALRRMELPLDAVLALDVEYRALLAAVEKLRAERNIASKAISAVRDADERARRIAEQREAGTQLDQLEGKLRYTQSILDRQLLELPNVLDARVPEGGEDDAVVVLEGDGAT
ncbi:MAG: serine--tRNA ligase, partial [Chloroflexi bacterium]|nr:serine--tRNA ligase [Chloroflexota bacterium]